MAVSDKDFIYFGAQRAAIHSSCTDMRRICLTFLSNSEASVALDCVLEQLHVINILWNASLFMNLAYIFL